ncbi:chord-domain-containing protein [Pseudovirgaria hyperparasitica]|uniref:Chord-domain-containing protein n=1 Tax=Pseudovirgaria hyperparasitica TaxID=470096 RepID=A0A6A6WFC8_9PEZI|nr:chord-domain-containing protein [Pseudovirgaria hyperparasitica]KAF2761528.1 chord-domain-containing protein [Pseudovirgaria hyperparasitica]
MSAKKCVHKGCGKVFSQDTDPCVYHPGPPIFHEGQKGWKCCKPRVLTFDEFLDIPPCTTGTHSTVDDTPAPAPKPVSTDPPPPTRKPVAPARTPQPPTQSQSQQPQHAQQPAATPAPPDPDPETSDDTDTLPIPASATCRRKACGTQYTGTRATDTACTHHPGSPIFHEGSKGWTCCKRRVLEFDEFMRIAGCVTKPRHLYVGSGRAKPETLQTVRTDYYQTATTVIASLYLKKIDKERSRIEFRGPETISLDLKTGENKAYKADFPLFGPVDVEKSSWRVGVAKLEFTLVKADGRSWATLRSDEKASGIFQVGKAGNA